MSCPKRPRRTADPGSSPSNSRTAPTVRLLQAFAPPPSSTATQNPLSFRPIRPEYSWPQRRVSCRHLHQCCQTLPPHLTLCAASVPLGEALRSLSPSKGKPALPCPSLSEAVPRAKDVPCRSNTQRRN